jgi:protein-disulfide isomerase
MKQPIIFILLVILCCFYNESIASIHQEREALCSLQEDDHYIGDLNAPIVMIGYTSFSCHACASFHKELLPKLKKEYIDKGKLLYIFRDYPSNKQGLDGAIFANCFKDRYIEVSEILYERQSKWIFRKDCQKTLIKSARLFGYDQVALENCFNDQQFIDKILTKSYQAKETLGIDSTPIFFLNGKKISGILSWKKLQNLIDKE